MGLDKVIIDADICIKLGNSPKYRFLEILLPLISDKVYMHNAVYNEILIPACAREQVNTLIGEGVLDLIDEEELSPKERMLYDATYKSLADVMINKNNPKKNAGEVASLAMAKTISITYFMTDERNLQPIIDEKLNSGIDDIRCIRIIDIIHMIKDGEVEGFKRKNAKALWRLSGKSTDDFDKRIWPI